MMMTMELMENIRFLYSAISFFFGYYLQQISFRFSSLFQVNQSDKKRNYVLSSPSSKFYDFATFSSSVFLLLQPAGFLGFLFSKQVMNEASKKKEKIETWKKKPKQKRKKGTSFQVCGRFLSSCQALWNRRHTKRRHRRHILTASSRGKKTKISQRSSSDSPVL